MAAAAQSYTLQLSSALSDQVTAEHYLKDLEPAISVPYLAQPRAQLEQLAFVNSFTNVDSDRYNNNKVTLAWRTAPHTHDGADKTAPSAWNTYTMTLDDGHYTLPSLELHMAKKLYEDTLQVTSFNNDIAQYAPGKGSLWGDMDAYTRAAPESTDIYITPTEVLAVGAKTFVVDKIEYHDGASKRTLAGAKPPACWIGNCEGGAATDDALGLFNGKTITAITYSSTSKKYSITMSAARSGNGGDNDPIKFNAPAQLHPLYAYGLGGLALPTLNADSGWSDAPHGQELQMVARTWGTPSMTAIVDVDATTAQYDRKAHPFNFSVDLTTSRLTYLSSWPGVYVCKGSTLFTQGLGFDDKNLATVPNADGSTGPSNPEMALQNPWAAADGSVSAADKRTFFTSTGEVKLNRVRSVEFHCPTLCGSSYAQDTTTTGGPQPLKLQGAQMASVPVVVGQNQTQVYQASYDNSVPTNLHGGDISSIEFFLTNQDGEQLNLQGSNYQATIRVFWDDPVPPKLGEAGAERVEALALRDMVQY